MVNWQWALLHLLGPLLMTSLEKPIVQTETSFPSTLEGQTAVEGFDHNAQG